jgi:hypothetical protein
MHARATNATRAFRIYFAPVLAQPDAGRAETALMPGTARHRLVLRVERGGSMAGEGELRRVAGIALRRP